MNRQATVINVIRASALAFVVCGLAVAHVAAQAPAAAPAQGTSKDSHAPLRYARAKSGGTKIYNLADTKGVELLSAPAESLLAVYSENASYLEVEPAGGLEVWVSGQYLETTDEPGVLKVKGSSVNMRPSPSSTTENSYPLPRSLAKGDKVRAVSRAHPEKPMAEDWVRVYAPAGTRAWCKKSDVVDAAGSDLPAQFTAAQQSARKDAKLWVEPANAAAPKLAKNEPTAPKGEAAPAKPKDESKTGARPQGATADLAKANELYEAARTSDAQDFAAAKSAYQRVIEIAPTSLAADEARDKLEKIALHEELARIKSDKQAMERDRQKRLADAQDELRQANLPNDPLWGRFQARGWLEKDGERWVVRWAGKVTSEVFCSSGRYDLALFEGYQLGVIGALTRSESGGTPARFDVRRIEVLDAREKK